MTPSGLVRGLDTFVFGLLEREVAIDAIGHVAQRMRDRTFRVRWAGQVASMAPYMAAPDNSLAEYLSIVQSRHYSCVLNDGALLQIEYMISGQRIVAHRLTYCPCPFELDLKEMGHTPLLDAIESMDISAVKDNLRLRTPVRFDFDPVNATTSHSASHLHMETSSCRIPVRSAVDPKTFIGFIFSNFYPSLLDDDDIKKIPSARPARTLTPAERYIPHLEWIYA